MREVEMKMSIGSITLAAVACAAVGVSAQTQTPKVEPGASVTIIGCVEPSDQASGGSARKSDTKYMLTHAKSGKSGSKDSTGTTGTTGTSSGSQTASTYRLEGKDASLTPEVGHQVEIVAIVAEPDSATTGTSGSSSATAQAPKLRVETVRMIAAACPE
jgi:hypothetical protein